MLHDEELSVEQQQTHLSFLYKHIFRQNVEVFGQREVATADDETNDERRYLDACSYMSEDDNDEGALAIDDEEENTFC